MGNLFSLIGIRWVDSHNPTYFQAVYSEPNLLSIGAIISSLALFFLILIFCSLTRFNKNLKMLGIIVFCVILGVFLVTIPLNYVQFSYYIEETNLTIYPPALLLQLEILLAGISGILAATSFFNVSPLNKKEKELFLYGRNKILGSLISVVFFLIISGGVLTIFSALDDFVYIPKTLGAWLVMFPLLFFYLTIGMIAWLVEIYSKIRTAERELS